MTVEQEQFQDLISQGVSLMSVENFTAAKEVFEKAATIIPDSSEVHNHLGNVAANLNDYDTALDEFHKMLIIDPEDGEAYFALGSVYILKDEQVKALESFHQAEKLGYHTVMMYKIMADIFLDRDDMPQALRYINRAIQEDPLEGQLRLAKAGMLVGDGKYAEALECLDEMEKILPEVFEVYDLRSQIYCGLKRYDEALKVCEEGIEQYQKDENLKFSKLKVLKRDGISSEHMAEAAVQQALIWLEKNDFDQAAKVLEEEHARNPEDQEIMYLLIDLYGKTNQLERVIPIAEELMQKDDNLYYKATASYYHAFALEKTGKKEQARGEYRKLTSFLRKLTIDTPGFYEGYIYRLLSHSALEEYDKALELADYLENVNPGSGDSNAFRYFIYKQMGDEEKAEQEKNITKSLRPEFQL